MKILFSAPDSAEVRLLRKKLFQAGIKCEMRKNPITQGLFGIPAYPELWIKNDGDIVKALRLLGRRRLSDMTVIFPQSNGARQAA